jgi:hypothetical protein
MTWLNTLHRAGYVAVVQQDPVKLLCHATRQQSSQHDHFLEEINVRDSLTAPWLLEDGRHHTSGLQPYCPVIYAGARGT